MWKPHWFKMIVLVMLTAAPVVAADLTSGWTAEALKFKVQYPYDLKQGDRYSFDEKSGIYSLRVLNSDKPFNKETKTPPRTEMRFADYTTSTQFEADAMVPTGTNNVCIVQIHSSDAESAKLGATTFMADVRDHGTLRRYDDTLLLDDIYDKWFHINVIHDMGAHTVSCFINGKLMDARKDNGATGYIFKCGVYEQPGGSAEMKVFFKNVKLWSKG